MLAGKGPAIDKKLLANELLARRRDDGTWSIWFDGPPDLSVTVEAYTALKLAGVDAASAQAKKRDVDRQLASKYEERARALVAKGDEAGAALFGFQARRHADAAGPRSVRRRHGQAD